MSTTISQFNQQVIDYLKERSDVEGVCFTCSFACENGGRGYHMHSKRLRNVIADMRRNYEGPEALRESAEAALDKAEALASDKDAWSGDYEGVCVHATRESAELIRLHYRPVEVNSLAKNLAFRPAADALASRVEMLALHLSFKQPELFLFDGAKAEIYGSIELPDSVFSFSEREVVDQGRHAHVRRAAARAGQPSIVSQNFSNTQSPRELNEPVFLQEISRALQSIDDLPKQMPLLVIGDEKLVSNFLGHYHHATGPALKGRSETAHPDEAAVMKICAETAWELQQDAKRKIVESLREVDQGSEQFSNNLKEVYEFARQGRVALCAVACDEDVWGVYSEDEGVLRDAEGPSLEPGVIEILDRIYVETLQKDGDAIALPASEIPGGKKVAAVLKW